VVEVLGYEYRVKVLAEQRASWLRRGKDGTG
jgi:hypothetical protein